MKKVFFLFLLVAIFGGHHFITRPSSRDVVRQSYTANTLFETKNCESFRSEIESALQPQESLSQLFWSTTLQACVYEKRTENENHELQKMELWNFTDNALLLKWEKGVSSLGEYRDGVISLR